MSFRLAEVEKSFGGVKALDGVTGEFPSGTIVGLIGPNGSGKTTLFNLITGFLPADGGGIWFRDRRLDNLEPHRIVELGIIRTFQTTRVFPRLTLLENLLVPTRRNTLRHIFSSPREKRHVEKAEWLLESIGLYAYRDEPAACLSYGQSKLLELALSFAADAETVLLDEPSAGINPTLQEKINRWIVEENREGKEFLIIEHNMELVMNVCRHVAVMHNGRMLAQGTPKEIQENDRVLEAYLGD